MAALYARNKIKTVKYDCDIKLLFETYLNIVYKKASHKLHALARVSNHISQRKLGSILHSRKSNNKINNPHEKALSLDYKDSQSTLEKLLIPDKSLSVHHKHLQILAIKKG